MSKWEVFNSIKDNKNYLSEKQIVNLTKKSQPSVNRHLNSLVKGRKIDVTKKIIPKLNKMVKFYRVRQK